MKVKGTILSSAHSFVKENFPNRLSDWLNNLSSESKELYNNPILASEWYDIKAGLFDPTEKIAEMFYNNDTNKAAWEMGRRASSIPIMRAARLSNVSASSESNSAPTCRG